MGRIVSSVTLAAFIAAAAFVPPAAATSAPALDCTQQNATPNNFTRADLAACGISTYPLSGTSVLPGGGTSYNYDTPTGTFSDLVLPVGFDPVTAGPELDQLYGIPPAPPDPAGRAQWVTGMESLQPQSPPASNSFVAVLPAPRHDYRYNPIWGGWQVETNAYNMFTGDDTWYTEPHITETTCTSPQSVAFWGGVGGTGGVSGSIPDLLGQDGTEWDPGGNKGQGTLCVGGSNRFVEH
jgi:hypothetical protein